MVFLLKISDVLVDFNCYAFLGIRVYGVFLGCM